MGGDGEGTDRDRRGQVEGLVLVNGGPSSIQAPRARALFANRARIVYKNAGRLGSAPFIARAIRSKKTEWIYCIDLGVPGAPLAVTLKRDATPLIYELGDPAGLLLHNQSRPGWHVALANWIDRDLPRRADALVFRGTYLRQHFQSLLPHSSLPPSAWIPDGVDTTLFRPCREAIEVKELRKRWRLEDAFVVGIVGSINYSPRFDLFYGWELAEALALLRKDANIVAAVVGDGPGLPLLRERATSLGVADRMRLIGRVPHHEIPLWINAFDVAVSTQTDDPVGWGRTTAKLPEYLACGTTVVSSDVGEAHRLLKPSGQTLPYVGMRDPDYPGRLAERLKQLKSADVLELRRQNRELALSTFDYRLLGERVSSFIQSIKKPPTS